MRLRIVLLTAVLLLVGCTTPGSPGIKSSPQHPTAIKVETLMKTTTSWDNKPLPAYPTTQPEISILRITIPPLTALPEHQHPIINTGVLISGNLEAVSEHGDTLSLHAGDTIAEVVNTWHYGRNPSDDEPAVIIVVYVGTPGTPLTIKRDGTMGHEE